MSGPKLPLRVHVAGTARDCDEGLRSRLESLRDTLDLRLGHEVHFHLFENDSSDDSRATLLAFQRARPNVTIHLADELTAHIPRREERIAFCRNRLLASISSVEGSSSREPNGRSIYLPVDLDLEVDWSALSVRLEEALIAVSRGDLDGVFPLSTPTYYDIYALRAVGWTSVDVWQKIGGLRSGRLTGRVPKWAWRTYHVESRQFAAEDLHRQGGLIEVASAFGGFGIYRWSAVADRSYACEQTSGCEHVAFNRGLDLAISSGLVVPAPPEHLAPSHPSRSRQLLLRLLRWLRLRIWRVRRFVRTTSLPTRVRQRNRSTPSGSTP